ncbi:anti-sigma factor family protein [Desulfotomaculum copahuensis]|uniref:Anti-sigma-W factor RsiW n=1 Tax=Desulfotomaculum copahuensis TaxID=1838280 RepID=A0A1B7LC24_9FIRM|nr:zf-HC2 domain-containing protein [Desulfotomaculum copahuensis]OAT80296.1 hypothetical protein A6M21_13840 [Desulfotomaculum copahuensis]
MRCNEAKPLLSAFLDGELTAGERQAVGEHLAHCPACAACRREIDRAGQLVRELAVPVVSPDLTARIVARIALQPAYGGGIPSLFGAFLLLLFLAVPGLIFLSPAGGLLFALVRVGARNLFALFNLGIKLPVSGMNLLWSATLLLLSGLLFYGLRRVMRTEAGRENVIHEG